MSDQFHRARGRNKREVILKARFCLEHPLVMCHELHSKSREYTDWNITTLKLQEQRWWVNTLELIMASQLYRSIGLKQTRNKKFALPEEFSDDFVIFEQDYHLLVGDGREPHCLCLNFSQQLARNFTGLAYLLGKVWVIRVTHKGEDDHSVDGFQQLVGLTEDFIPQIRNVSIVQNITNMVMDVLQNWLNILLWDVALSSQSQHIASLCTNQLPRSDDEERYGKEAMILALGLILDAAE